MAYGYEYDADAAYESCTADELRAEDRDAKRRLAALIRHPDPRDPDYPGDLNESEADRD